MNLVVLASLVVVSTTAAYLAAARELPRLVRELTERPSRTRPAPRGAQGEADGVILQRTAFDCGDAALAMVFRHFHVAAGYDDVARLLRTTPAGASMLALRELARAHGLRSEGWRLAAPDLDRIPLPAILLLYGRHYGVLHERLARGEFVLLDPARGRLVLTADRLLDIWTGEALLFGTPEATGPWLGSLRHSQP
jgi:hypothetical protein